jgi:hypothetical protein
MGLERKTEECQDRFCTLIGMILSEQERVAEDKVGCAAQGKEERAKVDEVPLS